MSTLMISLAIAAALLLSACGSAQQLSSTGRSKCNALLTTMVDRYATLPTDTTISISVSLAEGKEDEAKKAVVGCGATIMTETPGILFLRTPTKNIPCIVAHPGVESADYTSITRPAQ